MGNNADRTKQMAMRHFAAVVIAAASIGVSTIASSAGTVTPKQALVQGVAATPRAKPEQPVRHLIVKLRDGATGTTVAGRARLREVQETTGVELTHVRDLAGGATLIALDAPVPLSRAQAVADRLRGDARVAYVEPDVMMRKLAVPNELRFSQWQWNLFEPSTLYAGLPAKGGVVAAGGANLPLAWDVSGGGSSDVVVAVIDTGIVNHPDLNGVSTPAPYSPAGRFVAGYDFVSPDVGAALGLPLNFVENDGQSGWDSDPTDPGDWVTLTEESRYPECDDGVPGAQESSWHGTHMAGIAAATPNNNLGIAGIGWNVRVQPVRALGKCGGSLSDIAQAIRWAAGLDVPGVPRNLTPARVISLSLGGPIGLACSTEMQGAINAARAEGSVVVAATGNDGDTSLISPANCDGVISVTAHAINGENADFANIGASTVISAPGGGSPVLLGAGDSFDDPDWSGYVVWSTVLFGPTNPWSVDAQNRSGAAYTGFKGTSVAAPHVAGVAALVKSLQPGATAQQVRDLIVANARPYAPGSACAPSGVFSGQCGAGLLDAARTLSSAAGTGSPAAPPVGGGGGGGALPLGQLLMLVALLAAARLRRRE
jgi:serine protease